MKKKTLFVMLLSLCGCLESLYAYGLRPALGGQLSVAVKSVAELKKKSKMLGIDYVLASEKDVEILLKRGKIQPGDQILLITNVNGAKSGKRLNHVVRAVNSPSLGYEEMALNGALFTFCIWLGGALIDSEEQDEYISDLSDEEHTVEEFNSLLKVALIAAPAVAGGIVGLLGQAIFHITNQEIKASLMVVVK